LGQPEKILIEEIIFEYNKEMARAEYTPFDGLRTSHYWRCKSGSRQCGENHYTTTSV